MVGVLKTVTRALKVLSRQAENSLKALFFFFNEEESLWDPCRVLSGLDYVGISAVD